MTQILSVRAYSRWRKAKGLKGQSHTSVQRAIRDGRLFQSLVRTEDGKTKIDAEAADREWARNTNAAQARGPGSSDAEDGDQGELFPGSQTAIPDDTAADRSNVRRRLAQAQAAQALYRAKLTRLEYEEKAASLVEKAAVASAAFQIGRTVRDALLNFPDRLAPLLAAEDSTTTIHEILTREITEALEALSTG